MKNIYLSITLLLSLATLIIGQDFLNKTITIDTEPSGAKLYLNDKPIGESPATLRVQNGLLAPINNIRVELDGYSQKVVPLAQEWKPGIAIAGACSGILFPPAWALLLIAKGHEPLYKITLEKE